MKTNRSQAQRMVKNLEGQLYESRLPVEHVVVIEAFAFLGKASKCSRRPTGFYKFRKRY